MENNDNRDDFRISLLKKMKKFRKKDILSQNFTLQELVFRTTFSSLYAAKLAEENFEKKQLIHKALNLKRSFNI